MRQTAILFLILCLFIPAIKSSAQFRTDSLYSKWIIDSRMGDFRNKTKTSSFLTATTARNVDWDYVPGLVAKGIIMAWEQYKDQPWSEEYFIAIQDYADHVTMNLGQSNIDDLNAGKIFFELYRGALEKGETSKAAIYKANATICRDRLKYNHTRIGADLPGTGGFWHKSQYVNQMWLDGLYMGPALYAEWQDSFGIELGEEDNTASWDDIALQFDTIFKYTWDPAKELNYHAWSAEPLNKASKFWADPITGRSQEFWARGVGWFFAALIDVLDYMPTTHPARPHLECYANMVADGLKNRQDIESGCWYQLLQYDDSKKGTTCDINNYLESSASAMFTYAYLKGIRLGVLDKETYSEVANKAYRGLIETFVVEEDDGKIKLIQSCESAGLSSTRKGDANYYLCGKDVPIHNDTEGKVFGPFIMASLEYEKLSTSKPNE
ncbi:MAG TPA: glycoside hydrolase family 88 protein [Marinilabiliaceae bacterium]|nr:glycoside hydrolase family 88 protein [Marinilabiliaceae bacterium]